jgi:GDPmannose 4,6-dehydratase
VKALITGITGQVGSYLAELLLSRGYEVHGLVRRVALEDPERRLYRLRAVLEDLHLHAASLESYGSTLNLVDEVRPDVCFHLAAESFVSYSFDEEFSTVTTNIAGTHHVLAALKAGAPGCRFYFAGSSEMFGNARETPQNELTPFNPRSPYGIAKLAGYHLTRNYREVAGMFAVTGILFNTESPRRSPEFVTRKVSRAVARIKLGHERELRLGNLDARRDWGYAKDYVEAMWRMVGEDDPEDFVIATGETHSVRELVEAAFGCADLDWRDHVVVDESVFRPGETHELRGDASKARARWGWEPSVSFEELVRMMVEADLEAIRGGDTWY